MTKIIVDALMGKKLRKCSQPVELCDKSGKVLGRFTPDLESSEYEPLEPQVSEKELRRRSRSKEKTYTTAQVLAHLEKL